MNNVQITSMLETVESIFNAAQTTIEGMQGGERMQIKELAQAVGLIVAMEPKHVLGFVNHFVHNTDIAYVTRGKNGGIIRGTRPVKVIKVKKVKVAPVVADDSSPAV
jgi:hypothetical protein